MTASIHPYKGYLNTKFRVRVKGTNSISYTVEDKEGNHICDGKVGPNDPYELMMPHAGDFIIRFDNGSQREFFVEDGYKYGGNRFKDAFIFDDCPWAFVIMRDRTYFYNRNTEESYVEAISPDSIDAISEDYVFLSNESQEEITLYSLEEQRPVLWIDNVVYSNNEIICWKEQEGGVDKQILVLYSLDTQRITHRLECDDYSIDNDNKTLYYHLSGNVFSIMLCSKSEPQSIIKTDDEFITFVQEHYAIFKSNRYTKLIVFDAKETKEIGKIPFGGTIARVNDKKYFNVWSKYQKLKKFDFASFELPEATINCIYSELDIYPCEWADTLSSGDIEIRAFYTEKTTEITSSEGRFGNYTRKEEKCRLKAVGSDIEYTLKKQEGKAFCNQKYFLFYNSDESIVVPRSYPTYINYRDDAKVYRFERTFVLQNQDNEVRVLSNNGFWDESVMYQGDLDFSYFELFGIVKNNEDKQCFSNRGVKLGEYRGSRKTPRNYVHVGDYRIFEGGQRVAANNCPLHISRDLQYGLSVNSDGVYLKLYDGKKFTRHQILQDIFETNQYINVLLSENGQQILYRNNNISTILDLASGKTMDFDNLSYINHVNGIRPLIRFEESSQAILINPYDGQPIDFDLLSEYQFVSPDGKYYADKELSKYTEYHNLLSNEKISKESYLQMIEDYEINFGDDDSRKSLIKQNRKDLLNTYYDFFATQLKKKMPAYENRTKSDIIEALTTFGAGRYWFTKLFIDIRGVAVVRRVSDKSEYTRISLGHPLWFLNYVAFSKDSKYVAIAGRYPDGSNDGGLFLIYDLETKQDVVRETDSYAVWTAAFSQRGAVAAYTSNPITFFADAPRDYANSTSDNSCIDHYNFLTFSPDGEFFACSKQGYLRYRKPDGKIRANWGHQPSSLVSIRNTKDPQNEIISYYDLSDMGIADTMKARSVASVSFSNDNTRLMMVGRDGTVIVRNLHLKNYASE